MAPTCNIQDWTKLTTHTQSTKCVLQQNCFFSTTYSVELEFEQNLAITSRRIVHITSTVHEFNMYLVARQPVLLLVDTVQLRNQGRSAQGVAWIPQSSEWQQAQARQVSTSREADSSQSGTPMIVVPFATMPALAMQPPRPFSKVAVVVTLASERKGPSSSTTQLSLLVRFLLVNPPNNDSWG